MKILLTGAAGFVGRAAVDILSQDHEVTAFDVRPVVDYDNAIQGDVLDYATLETVMAGHDAVVNTIMAPNSSYGMDGPGFDINVRVCSTFLKLRVYARSNDLSIPPVGQSMEDIRRTLSSRTIYILSKPPAPMIFLKCCRKNSPEIIMNNTVFPSHVSDHGALLIQIRW